MLARYRELKNRGTRRPGRRSAGTPAGAPAPATGGGSA